MPTHQDELLPPSSFLEFASHGLKKFHTFLLASFRIIRYCYMHVRHICCKTYLFMRYVCIYVPRNKNSRSHFILIMIPFHHKRPLIKDIHTVCNITISDSITLFRKKRFMLDEKFHRKASKFAILYTKSENPKLLFPFFISCYLDQAILKHFAGTFHKA